MPSGPGPTDYSWRTFIVTVGALLLLATIALSMMDIRDENESGTCGALVDLVDHPEYLSGHTECADKFKHRATVAAVVGSAAVVLIVVPPLWHRRARRHTAPR